MKIGIVTITAAMNYGQRLQNYAVEQVLKSIGISSSTILLDPSYLLSVKERIILMVNALLKRGDWKTGLRPLNFDNFNKKNIVFDKNSYIDRNFNQYDFILCGSDQIWNLNCVEIENNTNYYFAQFVEPQKRVAYSASIGTESLSDSQREFFKVAVSEMCAVSVREIATEKMLCELTGKTVISTVDPVLMLDEKQWNKIATRPSFIKKGESYLLTYFLGEPSSDLQKYISKVAKAHGLKVISLCGDLLKEGTDYRVFSANPGDFVWLISHSTIVMTDSFHGCAFSCIYKKPFKWFSRSNGASMNCRIESLFSVLKIGGHAIGNTDESPDEALICDYQSIDCNIQNQREKALNYLKQTLLQNGGI